MEQVSDFLWVAGAQCTPQHDHTCLLSRCSCIAFLYTQTKASSLTQFPHLCCCCCARLCAAVVCGVLILRWHPLLAAQPGRFWV